MFLLLSSVAHFIIFVIYDEGIPPTESRDPLIMRSRDMQEEALIPPPLKLATGNLVNLDKTNVSN